ncbi:hypothetical protein Tco_1502062 [Tanacetum coccineum]
MALGYQNPFYLKQAQQKQQSLYNGKVLLEKHDPPAVYDSEETLQLAQETKFVQDFKSLTNEADESLAKHKALEFEIERLLRAVVSQDIMSIVQNPTVIETSDLQIELEYTLDPLSQKLENENVELEFQVLNYAKENAHLKTTYKNLINLFKTSKEDKFMPINKVRASVRTNPITVSQPRVIIKKDVNSDSNGSSSTGVDNTARTRRP